MAHEEERATWRRRPDGGEGQEVQRSGRTESKAKKRVRKRKRLGREERLNRRETSRRRMSVIVEEKKREGRRES
jgi:hypothetical protein